MKQAAAAAAAHLQEVDQAGSRNPDDAARALQAGLGGRSLV